MTMAADHGVRASHADVAPELGLALARVRRALRRSIRDSGQFTPLDDAQLEVLRLLHHSPPLRIRDAAAALQLRSNTVSTLATRLERAGLVQRRPHPDDRRGALLVLTAHARRRTALWRDRRHAVLTDALGALDAEDAAAIAGAVPALSRLADLLEAGE